MTPAPELAPPGARLAAISHPFVFLRHGETEWNRARRVQGRLNSALNAAGRAQAVAAARRLAEARPLGPVRRIVASPLSRAWDTACAAAHALGPRPEPHPDLAECGLGALEGLEKEASIDEYWTGRATPVGAETFADFASRVARALADAVDRPGVLVVSHGGVWRAAMRFVEIAPPFWLPNAQPILVAPERARAADGRARWRAAPLDPDAARFAPIDPATL